MALLVDDRELLRGFRTGDPEALLRVYDHYAPQVGAYFFARGIEDACDLDDLLQETFMRAFAESARRRYDGRRPFRNYLLTIAHNCMIDGGRRKRPTAVEPHELENRCDPSDRRAEPEQLARRGELQRLVAGFLTRLSSDDRELVRLRFEEGMSQSQAGARLGLSRQQVRTRERRLRSDLQAVLGPTGYMDFLHTEALSGALPASVVVILACLCRVSA